MARTGLIAMLCGLLLVPTFLIGLFAFIPGVVILMFGVNKLPSIPRTALWLLLIGGLGSLSAFGFEVGSEGPGYEFD